MKKLVIWIACLLVPLLLGCGGAAKSARVVTAGDMAEEAPMPPPSPNGGYGYRDEAAAYDFDDGVAAELEAPQDAAPEMAMKREAPSRSTAGPGAPKKRTEMPPPLSSPSDTQTPDPPSTTPEEPMVMYTGFLKLRVKRLLESMDAITALTEEKGGYVESMTQQVMIVRIPKGDFEGAMAAFQALGEVLDRRVESMDVTEQFTDLGGRLAVAREARARLLELLEAVTDVHERLRIMQEIKRLTEQIESIESKLKTLQNLVDYFTITIRLVPVLDNPGTQLQRSPFPWIHGLTDHAPTLFDGKDEISMTLPKGFVLFEEDDTYRAQAADTTIIRAAVVDNEPRGDNRFWSDAVHHEMKGRGEILVDDGKAGKLSFRLYQSDDVSPRYYLIAVYAVDEDVYVVEVFYPNEASKTAHHKGVIRALKSFEVIE